MGTLIDTTIFISAERESRRVPTPFALDRISTSLVEQLGPDEEVAIAAITASELLHGVHRASPPHRGRREAFVETVLAAFPVIPFDVLCARAHARLWAELLFAGRDVGAHDRLVAATAIATGWRVATANVRHYAHVPGLVMIDLALRA